MSQDELSALKVLQQMRNMANYKTKHASGTIKKREKKRKHIEENQQETNQELNLMS